MYKMIVMDMDGTLLTDDKRISDRNKKALKDAASKGVKIAISTGRIFTSALVYGRMIGVDVPIISSNGAYIREEDKDEVIYARILGEENIRNILNIAQKYGLNYSMFSWNALFAETLIHTSLNYAKWNENLPEDQRVKIVRVDRSQWDNVIEENKDSILKMVMTSEDKESLAKCSKELKAFDIEVTSSYPINIEVMNKGVSKGNAVEFLAKYYKLDRSDIICMGDNDNDVSMIKYAGLGIAMGNGNEHAKEAADFITLSNEEDGVAYAIEKFVL
jgi:Cof subfamily protein (haloacid dehalogenase superfamily)